MHQLPISSSVWEDRRFAGLCQATGWCEAKALGVLVRLWAATRNWEMGREVTDEALTAAMAFVGDDSQLARDALEDKGYLVRRGVAWQVVDNERYFEVSAKMRAAGKLGGYRKHKARAPAKVAKPRKTKLKAVASLSPSSEVWNAYSAAYLSRYGVEPRRSACVNGQLGQLVARVGHAEAVQLAAWYLQHNSAFYVRTQHPVGALLKDCTGLHTQMARGQAVSDSDVRATANGSSIQDQLRRLAARA